MIRLFFAFCLILLSSNLFAQGYTNYKADTIGFYSQNLKDTLSIDVHYPLSFYFKNEAMVYPLIILFDSQHDNAHPYNIETINYLTCDNQMPDCIIVGIPFEGEQRYWRTSTKIPEGDSIAGIQKMEAFIFEELKPFLQKKYFAADYTIIAGHSRTGYLVNYLMAKKIDQFNVAISTSGFYSDALKKELQTDFFNIIEKKNSLFKYYMTAGTSIGEKTYYDSFSEMAAFLNASDLPNNFKWQFIETPFANHMTNYTMSLPPTLIDNFSSYNQILNNWLHKKLESIEPSEALADFQNDLSEVSQREGYTVYPSITHINSIASFYWSQKQYDIAIRILDYGKTFYPKNYDFDLFLAFLYTLKEDEKMVSKYINSAKKLVEENLSILTDEDLKAFEEELIELQH